MIARRWLPSLAALALFCACSQGAPTAFAPQSPTTGDEVLAKLVINVPAQRHRHGRAPKYISPATASLTYAVDGGTPIAVSLSTSNPDCTGSVSLQCTVRLSLKPGKHTLSLKALDANHNLLSGNTDVSANIKRGNANKLAVTLGGVARSIAIFGPNAPEVTGNQNQGFVLYGNTPVNFSFVPVDADGNFIIGPGAPRISVSPNPTDVTVSTPPPTSPTNRWTMHSVYAASNPTIAVNTTITAVASPVPNSGGTTVTATASLTLYQPWLYLTRGDGSVAVYDEVGHSISPAGTWANLTGGGAMAYAPNNGFIYIEDPGASQLRAYDAVGNYQFSVSTGVSDIGIGFDPNTVRLYVALANNTMKAYDLLGNSISLGGSWSGLASGYAVAPNPSNNLLYVPNYNGGVTVYDEDGNEQTLPGTPFANTNQPNGIAYNPHKGWFYINNYGDGTTAAYDGTGVQQTTSGTFGTNKDDFANGLAFDPYNRSLYVLNIGATVSLTRYDENGQLIAPISIPPSPFPVGILEVP